MDIIPKRAVINEKTTTFDKPVLSFWGWSLPWLGLGTRRAELFVKGAGDKEDATIARIGAAAYHRQVFPSSESYLAVINRYWLVGGVKILGNAFYLRKQNGKIIEEPYPEDLSKTDRSAQKDLVEEYATLLVQKHSYKTPARPGRQENAKPDGLGNGGGE